MPQPPPPLTKRSQEEIFATYPWWDKGCALNAIVGERCTYIECCVTRVLGRGALHQQQILEVGCGGGLISEELARRGAQVIGVDPSPAALATARAHTQQSGLGSQTHFLQAAAEALPFAAGSFSVIVCLDVLEHVHDLHTTISEIARVLAPGGVFVFDTINRTLMARIALIWVGERFFQRNGLVPGLHEYHAFIKPVELQHMLSTHALHVNELVGLMPTMVKRRFTLRPGWFMGVSYGGYATKTR
ncbi:MAG TPA: bifunctional 2-polyprenyl-6-hydroxyphenol methylase/3-demethylubiquinol 3-O-methyltransferase UbiG [Ktedonobacteraceae bacterium]|nr:bifunctional 2-polyprenyl-6-hydroxyphenol methylase/3-demethylubiquinol 3-O-methyltransferase UbiG [Ktedonobacteraceae bacterium]